MIDTLYIECKAGAAGDMLTGALLELHPNPEDFLLRLNALFSGDVVISRESSEKCGIMGTHMRVVMNGVEECADDVSATVILNTHDHSHEHDDDHDHNHDHEHTHGETHHHHHVHGLLEIRTKVESFALEESVKKDILAIYDLIAKAESEVHGKPVEEVHFHEVGALDALADITAVCLLMNELSPSRILCSPIAVGNGMVRCAHGVLPVPAPATTKLLMGIPYYAGMGNGETCTPTGAAILRYFVNEFTEMPVMTVSKLGIGMGTKDFPFANCVRIMSGETNCASSAKVDTELDQRELRNQSETSVRRELRMEDEVVLLSCNLDDMTGEDIGFAMEQFMKEGALDAFSGAIQMKKQRPGILLQVLVKDAQVAHMLDVMFANTTTLGIRIEKIQRAILARREESKETPDGMLRCKVSEGYGVVRVKPEYEDLARMASDKLLTLEELRRKYQVEYCKEEDVNAHE